MIIKVFTKGGCPKCPPARDLAEKLKEKGENVEMYNLDEADGLAEASMYDVMSTPSIVVTDKQGDKEKTYRGEVPRIEEILGTN